MDGDAGVPACGPVGSMHERRRDRNARAVEEDSGLHDEMADDPALVVQQVSNDLRVLTYGR